MQKIKVLVVDDHTLVRDGIRALLALVVDIEVVGEAEKRREAAVNESPSKAVFMCSGCRSGATSLRGFSS